MPRTTRCVIAAALAGAAMPAVARTYPIVDTGQDTCYDNSRKTADPRPGRPFYGQDAQHDGNQPSYTVSDDKLTVTDNVTGLVWTRSADWNCDGTLDSGDKYSYTDALRLPAKANVERLGGYDDWRLPTIKELYSLIDYRGTDPDPRGRGTRGLRPFIDDSAFEFMYGDMKSGERIIDSQWATTTLYTGKVMHRMTAMFGVNFADGRIKGYPARGGPRGADKLYNVRLVRGNPEYGVNDFADNHDGTITDKATGLMWAQGDSAVGMDWEDALAWAQEMNAERYLGHDDWRVPNAKELQSLVDYTRCPDATNSPAIDPLFTCTQITNEGGQPDYPFYWSSTTFLRAGGSGGNAVYVMFGRGLGSMERNRVIDVHGAGAQRSDPKTGDRHNFPRWGHGPQGDVQRVFNFVRLVRDAEPKH